MVPPGHEEGARHGQQHLHPGHELVDLQAKLGIIRNFIDIANNQFNFEVAFGPELAVHGAAQNVENNWQDG